jgi:hypothetical protein
MKENPEDRLSQAIDRLKQEGLSQGPPREVVDETLRRMAEAKPCILPLRNPQPAIRHFWRLGAAAAVLVVAGYAVGRLSASKPLGLDQIREALTPAVAAAIEPALRARVVDEVRDDYQIALVGLYVRVKEELTEQYRDDLNRLAVQTLAASNAVTNELLTQLVQNIDTAQTQDRRRITRALYEIEMNREQDKTQLASGLQTLANRTDAIAQLVADTRPMGFERPPVEPRQINKERNRP